MSVAVDGEPVDSQDPPLRAREQAAGVASTRSDPHADRVIVDLVPDGRTLFPVGRLDVDTTGLIVLTNDGVLANRLMHPRYGVQKTYAVRVRGKVTKRILATLREGVVLEDGVTAPAEVTLRKQSAKTALVDLTIHEGRKRQVKRMFLALGSAGRGAPPPPLRSALRQGSLAGRVPRARRRRRRRAAPRRRRRDHGGLRRGAGRAPDAGRAGGDGG